MFKNLPRTELFIFSSKYPQTLWVWDIYKQNAYSGVVDIDGGPLTISNRSLRVHSVKQITSSL